MQWIWKWWKRPVHTFAFLSSAIFASSASVGGLVILASALIFAKAASGSFDAGTVSLMLSAGLAFGAFVFLTQLRHVANQSNFTPF